MDQIEHQFIEFYQSIGKSQGLDDNLLTTMMAILFLEPDEVAMDDLAEKTGYSLASISNKAKFLEAAGFVKRISKPGTRKAFLYAEKDFLNVFKQAIIKKHENVISLAKVKIPEIIRCNKQKTNTEKEKHKLKMLESFYQQMLGFDTLLQHMIKEFDKLEANK